MKFIIEIDGETKYTYNVWDCFEYEDGSISPDTRLLGTDKVEEFTAFFSRIRERIVTT
jgi:hypothetical protein